MKLEAGSVGGFKFSGPVELDYFAEHSEALNDLSTLLDTWVHQPNLAEMDAKRTRSANDSLKRQIPPAPTG